MRHRKSFNHLSRTHSHRKAMLSNMANSLIKHKRITTTTAKAKALRGFVEPIITKSKVDSTHSRRTVFSYLQDKEAVTELFREVSPKIINRPGGYTRILKTGKRLGDNADMCIIELVDYNENLLAAKESDKKPGRKRSRRAGKKKSSGDTETTANAVESQETTDTANKQIDVEEKKVEEPKQKEEAITQSKEENTKVEEETIEKKNEDVSDEEIKSEGENKDDEGSESKDKSDK